VGIKGRDGFYELPADWRGMLFFLLLAGRFWFSFYKQATGMLWRGRGTATKNQ